MFFGGILSLQGFPPDFPIFLPLAARRPRFGTEQIARARRGELRQTLSLPHQRDSWELSRPIRYVGSARWRVSREMDTGGDIPANTSEVRRLPTR